MENNCDNKVTLNTLREMKAARQPIACLTAYDASFARIIDNAGADLVLTGDSLGMVVQGHATTAKVTMDDMVYHCRCVAAHLNRAFFVADMPFSSYLSIDLGVHNARRLINEGGAQMVKLEMVSDTSVDVIRALVAEKIPVCAHIGFCPQATPASDLSYTSNKPKVVDDVVLQQASDCIAADTDLLLVECAAGHLGERIRSMSPFPVIGIGSGADYDGQILVMHDVLGISEHPPKFAENFLVSRDSISAAFIAYIQAVRSRNFPES